MGCGAAHGALADDRQGLATLSSSRSPIFAKIAHPGNGSGTLNTILPLARRCLLLLAPAALAGCTFLEDLYSGPPGAERPEAVPLEARPVEEPISRNYFVLESETQSVIGAPQIVYTDAENTFSDLAREYGLGYDELVAANPDIDPWLPGDRTPVLLPTQYIVPDVPREGIVLNIAAKRLFYFPKAAEGHQQTVLTYPIGIGRVGWETPVGETEVVSKAADPHWFPPASVREEHAELGNPLPSVVPPGPDNPLGSHVLKLAMPGYLIHGTNQPYGVGMRVSHGCVRLYPENIELLYSLVEAGETVRIVNEPYLLGWRNGELYFEAHTPLEDDTIPAAERLDALLANAMESAGVSDRDADHIRSLASVANGVAALVSYYDAHEVFARASLVRNTVEPDPNSPTLTEVRELMDEVMAEEPEPEEKDL
jgi:L,D-transpeptidase ErfK/SrfK